MLSQVSQEKTNHPSEISIRRFFPSKHGNGPAIFIATPAMGYSTSIQNYLSQIPKVSTPELSEVFVFCDQQNSDGYTNLMKTDPFFSKSVASIFPDMTTNDIISKLKYILKHQIRQRKEEARIYIVIEDLNDPKLYESDIFYNFMKNGKCYGANVILHQQYPHLPQKIMNFIEYVFMAQTQNTYNRRQLYKCFAQSIFSFFEQFGLIFDELTLTRNSWMVIKYRGLSTRVEDLVYYLCNGDNKLD